MDKEKQRIKIAEFCGWECDPLEAQNWGSRGQWVVKPKDKKRGLVSKNMYLPKYLDDLNAMYEAEEMFSESQKNAFANEIEYELYSKKYRWTTTSEWDYDPKNKFRMIHITAAQRAEAFLRTLGLWED